MESDIVSDSTNFNAVDLTSLTSPVVNDTKFRGVDILITSQWPKGVEKYGTALVRKTNFSSIFFYQPQRLLTEQMSKTSQKFYQFANVFLLLCF